MSLIEGFGDEVTIFLAILLILFVICLAWISTNIRDIPFFSVIIIELTHRRNRNTDNANQTEVPSTPENIPLSSDNQTNAENGTENVAARSETESAEDRGHSPSTVDDGLSENSQDIEEEESSENRNTDSNVVQESVSDGIDTSIQLNETELRRRRLNFFQGNKDSGTISNSQTVTDTSNVSQTSSQSSLGQGSVTEPITSQDSVPVSFQNETVQSRETDAETGLITVRLKYLNDTQRNVTAAPNVTIGQFRRYKHFVLLACKLCAFVKNYVFGFFYLRVLFICCSNFFLDHVPSVIYFVRIKFISIPRYYIHVLVL